MLGGHLAQGKQAIYHHLDLHFTAAYQTSLGRVALVEIVEKARLGN